MDLVLGLSLTSTAVRWVLVEGTTGEGAPIDRGALDVASLDASALLDVLLHEDVVGEVHAVGVTWTHEAVVPAGAVMDALADRGMPNVVAVSDVDAARALATGIADITDHDAVAVCVVEPDAALVAMVSPGGVTVERIHRPSDGDDAFELTSSVIAMLDVADRRPEAIFVVGSDDVEVIVSSFEAILDAPVFSASEAGLALARGAALATAGGVDAPRISVVPVSPPVTSRVRLLAGVLGAAVVMFVVSLSVALGLSMTPGPETPQPQNAAVGEETPVAVPSVRRAAPSPRPVAPPPTKTIKVAAPPEPEPAAVPVYEPPPAAAPVEPAPVYVPPAPAEPAPVYVPPPPANVPPAAPPAFVPPQQPPVPAQKPRLRDRIIERIPIINRFHEPKPYG